MSELDASEHSGARRGMTQGFSAYRFKKDASFSVYMVVDLMDDMAPTERIVSIQTHYGHLLKQAAGYLSMEGINPSLDEGIGLIVGMTSGNYADALARFRGRMPTHEAEVHLAQFIMYLRTIEIIGTDVPSLTGIVDEAFLCYSRLIDCLPAENPE